MPRLRKQSSLQRQRLATNRVNEYRERNPSDRLRNAMSIATRRLNVNFREEERERDRVSRQLRRHNSFNRRIEQLRDASQHSLRRQDVTYRQLERERDALNHQLRRQDESYRQIERETDAMNHQARRQDETYRLSEQQRNTAQRSVRREDEFQRQLERDRDSLSHRVRRQDEVYSQLERERDAFNHQVLRQDEVFRQQERERDALSHQVRRQDEVYRELERERNAHSHQVLRQDEMYREIERERDALSHQARRQDEVYSEIERERDVLNRQVRRQDETFRQLEQERDTFRRSQRRRNEIYRQTEREVDSQRRNVRRRDITYRIIEQVRNTEQRREARRVASQEFQEQNRIRHCRVLIHRMNPYNRELENNRQSERSANIRQNLSPESRREMLQADSIRHRSRQLKIPADLRGLTQLEERFVSPRIPFMRIVSLGYNRQCAVRGAVVNVPIQLNTTVNVLPRTVNQTEVVQVHLKRRLQYEHSFMTETIRPAKIYEAARYLVNTELYKKHNIVLSSDWLNSMNSTEEQPFISNVEDLELVSRLTNTNFIQDDVDEVNPQETLLDNNPVENLPLQRISIAPGEGQRPLDMLLDEDSEELSYPSIY
uniref:Uncharacterized protein n=1 Tax=Musca domestica TaxID=7370 RepID=A0A1I8MIT9_MUSDO